MKTKEDAIVEDYLKAVKVNKELQERLDNAFALIKFCVDELSSEDDYDNELSELRKKMLISGLIAFLATTVSCDGDEETSDSISSKIEEKFKELKDKAIGKIRK